MKKTILTLFLIVTGVAVAISQTTNNYVVKTVTQKDIVYLYMNPREYGLLSEIGKNALIKRETREINVKSVYVINGHNGELWQKEDDGMVTLVDSWDMDKAELVTAPNNKPTSGRSLQRPWFFNISGALGTAKSNDVSTINVYGYSRLGCYLLKGRWDMAINGLLGFTKTQNENKGSRISSFGLDTRVYILRGKAFNPYAGVGLAYSSNGGESSFTIPFSVGTSIPIKGKGCIDACYQYNKITKSTIIVGYTHMF